MGVFNAYTANRPRARTRKGVVHGAVAPAPTAGVDTHTPAAQASPLAALYSYNLTGADNGLVVRDGFTEYVKGLPSTIYTLIPFDSDKVQGQSGSKLFSVTKEGIYDTTNKNTAPTQKLAFNSQAYGAGYGNYTQYVDEAGKQWILYADQENGLFEYDPDADTWAQVGNIIDLNPAEVSYVVVHKQRLWLVKKNSTTAYYMPVGAKHGKATPFHFGSKFKHGGTLRGLYNWSVDGGAGLDDYLVAISGAGDVIPYQGSDPSLTNDWDTVGTFFVGAVPRGSNFTGEYAGELYILSTYGIIAMSDLLKGVQSNEQNNKASLTYKIASALRPEVNKKLEFYGWRPTFIPREGLLIITSPVQDVNQKPVYWVQNISTKAWSQWRGIPLGDIVQWHSAVMFSGDRQTSIYRLEGHLDNVELDSADRHINGAPIEFSAMTTYQDYNSPARFKMVKHIRTDFISTQIPHHETMTLYDFDLIERTLGTGAWGGSEPDGIWDGAHWDADIWDSNILRGENYITGINGMGRRVAIAIRGECSSRTHLIAFDVYWTDGGGI